MAFIQQKRIKKYVVSSSDEEEEMYLRPRLTVVSDSDTDWHILSSCNTSPILFPSSASYSTATEEEEETTEQQQQQQQTYLPSHDGTGTFQDEATDEQIISENHQIIYTPRDRSVISEFWKGLVQLGTHLIENDASTIETISGIMSDAMVEGCLPFGSHLHMEFDTTF